MGKFVIASVLSILIWVAFVPAAVGAQDTTSTTSAPLVGPVLEPDPGPVRERGTDWWLWAFPVAAVIGIGAAVATRSR